MEDFIKKVKQFLSRDLSKNQDKTERRIVKFINIINCIDFDKTDFVQIKQVLESETDLKFNHEQIKSNAELFADMLSLMEPEKDPFVPTENYRTIVTRFREQMRRLLQEKLTDVRSGSYLEKFKFFWKKVEECYSSKMLQTLEFGFGEARKTHANDPTLGYDTFHRCQDLAKSDLILQSSKTLTAELRDLDGSDFVKNLGRYNILLDTYLKSGVIDHNFGFELFQKYSTLINSSGDTFTANKFEIYRRFVGLCANLHTGLSTNPEHPHRKVINEITSQAFGCAYLVTKNTQVTNAQYITLGQMLVDLRDILRVRKDSNGELELEIPLFKHFCKSLHSILNTQSKLLKALVVIKDGETYSMINTIEIFLAELPAKARQYLDDITLSGSSAEKFLFNSKPSTIAIKPAKKYGMASQFYETLKRTVYRDYHPRGDFTPHTIQEAELRASFKKKSAAKLNEARTRRTDKNPVMHGKSVVAHYDLENLSNYIAQEMSLHKSAYDIGCKFKIIGSNFLRNYLFLIEFNGMAFHYVYDIHSKKLVLNYTSEAKSKIVLKEGSTAGSADGGPTQETIIFNIAHDDWKIFNRLEKEKSEDEFIEFLCNRSSVEGEKRTQLEKDLKHFASQQKYLSNLRNLLENPRYDIKEIQESFDREMAKVCRGNIALSNRKYNLKIQRNKLLELEADLSKEIQLLKVSGFSLDISPTLSDGNSILSKVIELKNQVLQKIAGIESVSQAVQPKASTSKTMDTSEDKPIIFNKYIILDPDPFSAFRSKEGASSSASEAAPSPLNPFKF
jgi:hypothetical protein